MLGYQTEQRKELLNFLMQHPHSQFSAKEIANALGKGKTSISAVYRNLAALEKVGEVRSARKKQCREACYEYVGAEECQRHLHLRCRQCGTITHLDSEATKRLVGSVKEINRFAIDCAGFILQGLCATCREDSK